VASRKEKPATGIHVVRVVADVVVVAARIVRGQIAWVRTVPRQIVALGIVVPRIEVTMIVVPAIVARVIVARVIVARVIVARVIAARVIAGSAIVVSVIAGRVIVGLRSMLRGESLHGLTGRRAMVAADTKIPDAGTVAATRVVVRMVAVTVVVKVVDAEAAVDVEMKAGSVAVSRWAVAETIPAVDVTVVECHGGCAAFSPRERWLRGPLKEFLSCTTAVTDFSGIRNATTQQKTPIPSFPARLWKSIDSERAF
jgi:hypothetical protein